MKRYTWLLVVLAIGTLFDAVDGADWPTYRGDARRSGYTNETLPDELVFHWMFMADDAPQPAWSDRDTRMPFDRVMHPVVADGRVFFRQFRRLQGLRIECGDGQGALDVLLQWADTICTGGGRRSAVCG